MQLDTINCVQMLHIRSASASAVIGMHRVFPQKCVLCFLLQYPEHRHHFTVCCFDGAIWCPVQAKQHGSPGGEEEEKALEEAAAPTDIPRLFAPGRLLYLSQQGNLCACCSLYVLFAGKSALASYAIICLLSGGLW